MYLNICSGSDLSDMQCMFQKDETHLWVAGHQGLMVDVDLRKGVISKTVMRWNRLLFIFLLNIPFCTKCHHDKNFLSIWWIFLNLFDWQNSVTSMLFLTYWRQYSFFFFIRLKLILVLLWWNSLIVTSVVVIHLARSVLNLTQRHIVNHRANIKENIKLYGVRKTHGNVRNTFKFVQGWYCMWEIRNQDLNLHFLSLFNRCG